jgi:hypothetical protein
MDKIHQSAMVISYGREKQHHLFYIKPFWDIKKYGRGPE